MRVYEWKCNKCGQTAPVHGQDDPTDWIRIKIGWPTPKKDPVDPDSRLSIYCASCVNKHLPEAPVTPT